MSAWVALAVSVGSAVISGLLILCLRALWALATELATSRTQIEGLRTDTAKNTSAIDRLTERVERVERWRPRPR